MSSAVVSIDLGILLPVLAPALGAAAVLVVDVLATRLRRTHYALALVSLLVGAVATVPGLGSVPGDARSTLCLPASPGRCLYAATAVASGLQLAALLGAVVTLLLAWPEDRETPPGRTAVTVSLVLTATAGATAVAAARDLGTWLVALELATLPVVALVALRGARSAITGAVALLTTSLVSFAMLAMAAALWLAATGQAFFDTGAALQAAADPGRRAVLVLAVVLALAGVGFKLSLVPFHAWTPEAYDGASLPVAAFLAGTSKVAALAALLVVVQAIAPLGAPVLTAVAVLAALSMTLGNVMALRQDDVRAPARVVHRRPGRLGHPAAGRGVDLRGPGRERLPAGLPRRHAPGVRRGRRPGARCAARSRPAPSSSYGSGRGLLREHPLLACALALALLSLAGPAARAARRRRQGGRPAPGGRRRAVAAGGGRRRPTPCSASRSTCAGCGCCSRPVPGGGRGRRAGRSRRPARAAGVRRRVHPAVLAAVALTFAALVLTSLAPDLLLHLLG